MGKNSWAGKKIGLIGASPGAQGTVSCQLVLRQMLGTLDAQVMGRPEAYVTFNPPTVIDESGNVNDPKIEKLLENFIAAFAKHTAV